MRILTISLLLLLTLFSAVKKMRRFPEDKLVGIVNQKALRRTDNFYKLKRNIKEEDML